MLCTLYTCQDYGHVSNRGGDDRHSGLLGAAGFPKSKCVASFMFLLAFCATERSELIYGNNGWRRKGSALAFEALSRRKKNKNPSSGTDKATPELYGLKLLDGRTCKTCTRSCPYLSSPHKKIFGDLLFDDDNIYLLVIFLYLSCFDLCFSKYADWLKIITPHSNRWGQC